MGQRQSRFTERMRQRRRGAPDPEQPPLVRALRAGFRIYARAYHDLRVISPCRLPARGPAILVCNHTSGLDPVLIQSACPRLIVWMMAREYYEIAALKWGFQMIRAIPVDRSGRDLAATRAGLRTLADGRVLGVFPEGRIEISSELLPFQVGAAMMSQRAAVDVYPAYLDGSQRNTSMLGAMLKPHRALLAFGPKVGLSWDASGADARAGGSQLDQATARIRDAVESLRTAAASSA